MKIRFLIVCLMLLISPCAFGIQDADLIREQSIQNRINAVGTRILNANKIDNRIIFVYNKSEKKSLLKSNNNLIKREVVLYDKNFKFIENMDEKAAYLAREIAIAARSYDGIANGGLSSLQIAAAPKKYEMTADKIAVDYMVKADYNPIGLITYINKSCPQRRFDMFSMNNLTSKRLAVIYEYIYTKYPYYLVNNPYLETDSYQNFLLTSANNRKLLAYKIRTKSTKDIKYE